MYNSKAFIRDKDMRQISRYLILGTLTMIYLEEVKAIFKNASKETIDTLGAEANRSSLT